MAEYHSSNCHGSYTGFRLSRQLGGTILVPTPGDHPVLANRWRGIIPGHGAHYRFVHERTPKGKKQVTIALESVAPEGVVSHAASMEDLPAEIFDMILEYLKVDSRNTCRQRLRDLHSLALTSRQLYNITLPALYETFSMAFITGKAQEKHRKMKKRNERKELTELQQTRLQIEAPLVKNLHMGEGTLQRPPQTCDFPFALRPFWTKLLPACSNLQTLSLHSTYAWEIFTAAAAKHELPIRALRLSDLAIKIGWETDLRLLTEILSWPRLRSFEAIDADLVPIGRFGSVGQAAEAAYPAGVPRQSAITSWVLGAETLQDKSALPYFLLLPLNLEHLCLKAPMPGSFYCPAVACKRWATASTMAMEVKSLRIETNDLFRAVGNFKDFENLEVLDLTLPDGRWQTSFKLGGRAPPALRRLIVRVPEGSRRWYTEEYGVERLYAKNFNLVMEIRKTVKAMSLWAMTNPETWNLEVTFLRTDSLSEEYRDDDEARMGFKAFNLDTMHQIRKSFKRIRVEVVWPANWYLPA